MHSVYFPNANTGYADGAYGTILKTSNSVGMENVAFNYNNQMSIYPNPNNGLFQLSVTDEKLKNATIIVIDMLGREVYHQNINNVFSQSIDITNQPSGMYNLTIESKGKQYRKRIVINSK